MMTKEIKIIILIIICFVFFGCSDKTINNDTNNNEKSEATNSNEIIEIMPLDTPNENEQNEPLSSEVFCVKFYDGEKLLKEENVNLGCNATPPVITNKPFYYFVGWDKDYKNVKNNLDIHSVYTYGVVEDTTGLLEEFLKVNLNIIECEPLKIIDENHIIVYIYKNRADVERELKEKNIEYSSFFVTFGSIYYDNIIDDIYIVYDYTLASGKYGYIACLSKSGERVIPGSLAYCGLTQDELLTEIPWPIVKETNPIEYRQSMDKIDIAKDEYDLMVETIKNYNNNNLEGYEIDGTISNSKTYSVSGDYDETIINGNIASSKYVGTFEDFILLELNLQHATYDVKLLYEVIGDRIIIENVDNRLLLYKDGKCYTLTEAYNSGLISLETIYSIPCNQIILNK